MKFIKQLGGIYWDMKVSCGNKQINIGMDLDLSKEFKFKIIMIDYLMGIIDNSLE